MQSSYEHDHDGPIDEMRNFIENRFVNRKLMTTS